MSNAAWPYGHQSSQRSDDVDEEATQPLSFSSSVKPGRCRAALAMPIHNQRSLAKSGWGSYQRETAIESRIQPDQQAVQGHKTATRDGRYMAGRLQ